MPTLEEFTQAYGVCAWCNQRSSLLCDGVLPDGKTCDKRICRRHAQMVAHVRTTRGCNTEDLCPDCVAAGRRTRLQTKAEAIA